MTSPGVLQKRLAQDRSAADPLIGPSQLLCAHDPLKESDNFGICDNLNLRRFAVRFSHGGQCSPDVGKLSIEKWAKVHFVLYCRNGEGGRFRHEAT